jgi:hypothetical protein
MVCNGYEIASGSIRNQQAGDLMVKAFELTGLRRPMSRRASAACIAPSSTARRRMAAWRRVSTAW